MDLYAWTYSETLRDAKRIYSDALFSWECPECKMKVESRFNQVPLISYGSYCHVFYCHGCGYESTSKMYELVSINEDSVTINASNEFGLTIE